MIEFNTEVKKLLPYDRKQYLSLKRWYGVSFQLSNNEREITLMEFVNNYEIFFKSLVEQLDSGYSWIVNHDYVDKNWFPNEDDTLESLRDLFRQNNIPNTFKGALIFTKDDLLKMTKDLILYPSAVFKQKEILYTDIDISNNTLQFVIKISGHLNIDLLSTDKELLRKIVNNNSSAKFNIIEYRGTKL
ncbi:hypothetical protein ASG22_04035 [Chryseobacterium sp. Leaf405]|uniref:hypothetical protein n=1 Tax=Chryseobacterium sp. Leaf405 TaxID=1736367 RepID=UPI0006FF0A9A|nr:hypothetical protein [Chryseobacterium sp. Leaf405]KQT25878.1 hypothetical protein ASG22_04035 [Chryseobacterium sp. Leaf405]